MKERYGRGWRQGWSREKGGCRTHAGGMQEGCRQGYGQRCREGCRGGCRGIPRDSEPHQCPPPRAQPHWAHCTPPMTPQHRPAGPQWGHDPRRGWLGLWGGSGGPRLGWGGAEARPRPYGSVGARTAAGGGAVAVWHRSSQPSALAGSADPKIGTEPGGGWGGHDPVWGPHAPMSHRHGEGGGLRCAPRPYGTAGGVWGVPDPIGCGPWGGGRGGLPNVSRAARGPGRVTCVPPPPNIHTPK